jgi:glycosyltransferase involved in cell wall biosynthesis
VLISVVVPAYESWETLPLTLEALRPQVDRADRELVLVESSGTSSEEEVQARWPWLTAVVFPSRILPGRARNIGSERARGELIAFTDADAVPEAGWLDSLEHALGPDTDAVAGAVVNGTPKSAIGTSDYLLEFAAWLPGRAGAPLHGATCNLLVRQRSLAAAGGFPTDLWPG